MPPTQEKKGKSRDLEWIFRYFIALKVRVYENGNPFRFRKPLQIKILVINPEVILIIENKSTKRID